MDKITLKELKIIDSIYRNSNTSQRNIARDGGFSLGLTNILINRLIKEGYIKVSRLNAKKMSYIITPRGLKEKARKSYRFMRRSFSVINKLKRKISDFALDKYSKGKRKFLISGNGELSDITELVLSSLKLEDAQIIRADNKGLGTDDDIVIFNTTRNNVSNHSKQLDIWKEAEKIYGSSYEI